MGKTQLIAVAGGILYPALALAQEPGQTLPTDQAIPGLMFFTLLAGLAIAIGAFVFFLRKRSNRAAAEKALGLEDGPKR